MKPDTKHEICAVCGADRTLLREMMKDGDSACRFHKAVRQ